MSPLIWLSNTLRNSLRNTLVGNVMQQMDGSTRPKSLRIVSATRLTEKAFWKSSALGRSLKLWLTDPAISIDIRYQNKEGLSSVYNSHLQNSNEVDVLLFVHDDIWLDDPQWLPKIMVALDRFDIVGVAGNTRISPNQPAWLFSKMEDGKFSWDSAHLSGAVAHGQLSKGQISVYGPTPAKCELLDGAFIAVRCSYAHRAGVLFDEQFDFHFYDMDFCRTARRAGLSLGTWPISVTHQSSGSFGNPSWSTAHSQYWKKWKS
jgi:GT2 family glycosyltransferase